MQHEDDDDDFDKHRDDGGYLSRDGHVEEDAEDVQRQQRYDDLLDEQGDDVAQVGGRHAQRVARYGREPQADTEGEEQGGHDVEGGGHLDGEEGFQGHLAGVVDRCGLGRLGNEPGEDGFAGKVGEESREYGRAVGNERRDEQQPAGPFAQVGDGGDDEADDDERDDEVEEVAEEPVEGDKQSGHGRRKELPQHDAGHDGDKHLPEERDAEFFHNR